eukprot:m.193397 g.193397  ORF g.193397 m.193397 type:complete len:384 (-) comp53685_c0_seq4:589-1740(-)
MGNCLGKESPPPMADRGAELHEVSNRSTASEAPVTQPLPPPQAQPTRQAAASPPSPQLRRRPQDQKPAPNEVFVEDTTVEHISDREDIREKEARIMTSVRPSSTGSPKARRQSSSEAFKSPKRQVSQQALEAGLDGLHNAKKFNSTSTLFVDSTASQPNKQETIKCVALSLCYMIQEGHRNPNPVLYSNIFDEKSFPLTEDVVPANYKTMIPSDDDIYFIMNALFEAAVLPVECAIVTLVYISRVMSYTNLSLHASNWKRVLLGAILMASKVWDDQAVWNADFCSMLPSITVDEMNDLERTYLEMLQFNINVDSSVYTKFYFDLRALAEENNKAFPLEPLTKAQAEQIEALSNKSQMNIKRSSLRNAKSLDLHVALSKPAIIS